MERRGFLKEVGLLRGWGDAGVVSIARGRGSRERRCSVGQVETGWRGEAPGRGGAGSEAKSLEGTARLEGGKGHVCKTGKTWKPGSVEGGRGLQLPGSLGW